MGRRGFEARPLWERFQELALERDDPLRVAHAWHRLDGDSMKGGLDALYTRRMPAEAVEHFRLVLRYEPEHYGAHFQLALALEEAGLRDESIRQWRSVLERTLAAGDRRNAEIARERLDRLEAGRRNPGNPPD